MTIEPREETRHFCRYKDRLEQRVKRSGKERLMSLTGKDSFFTENVGGKGKSSVRCGDLKMEKSSQ